MMKKLIGLLLAIMSFICVGEVDIPPFTLENVSKFIDEHYSESWRKYTVSGDFSIASIYNISSTYIKKIEPDSATIEEGRTYEVHSYKELQDILGTPFNITFEYTRNPSHVMKTVFNDYINDQTQSILFELMELEKRGINTFSKKELSRYTELQDFVFDKNLAIRNCSKLLKYYYLISDNVRDKVIEIVKSNPESLSIDPNRKEIYTETKSCYFSADVLDKAVTSISIEYDKIENKNNLLSHSFETKDDIMKLLWSDGMKSTIDSMKSNLHRRALATLMYLNIGTNDIGIGKTIEISRFHVVRNTVEESYKLPFVYSNYIEFSVPWVNFNRELLSVVEDETDATTSMFRIMNDIIRSSYIGRQAALGYEFLSNCIKDGDKAAFDDLIKNLNKIDDISDFNKYRTKFLTGTSEFMKNSKNIYLNLDKLVTCVEDVIIYDVHPDDPVEGLDYEVHPDDEIPLADNGQIIITPINESNTKYNSMDELIKNDLKYEVTFRYNTDDYKSYADFKIYIIVKGDSSSKEKTAD